LPIGCGIRGKSPRVCHGRAVGGAICNDGTVFRECECSVRWPGLEGGESSGDGEANDEGVLEWPPVCGEMSEAHGAFLARECDAPDASDPASQWSLASSFSMDSSPSLAERLASPGRSPDDSILGESFSDALMRLRSRWRRFWNHTWICVASSEGVASTDSNGKGEICGAPVADLPVASGRGKGARPHGRPCARKYLPLRYFQVRCEPLAHVQ
jgi:hypothetical protein